MDLIFFYKELEIKYSRLSEREMFSYLVVRGDWQLPATTSTFFARNFDTSSVAAKKPGALNFVRLLDFIFKLPRSFYPKVVTIGFCRHGSTLFCSNFFIPIGNVSIVVFC
jgi:hypothetical protein